jgi:hypothetical protein
VHSLPAAAALAFGAGLDSLDEEAAVLHPRPLRAPLAWRPGRVTVVLAASHIDMTPDPVAIDVVVARVVPARRSRGTRPGVVCGVINGGLAVNRGVRLRRSIDRAALAASTPTATTAVATRSLIALIQRLLGLDDPSSPDRCRRPSRRRGAKLAPLDQAHQRFRRGSVTTVTLRLAKRDDGHGRAGARPGMGTGGSSRCSASGPGRGARARRATATRSPASSRRGLRAPPVTA